MENATLTTDNFFADAEIISRYTRAQAIEDGVLVDVSGVGREAGIRFPVAMTSEVWAKCVEIPEGILCQDEAGRLWDILFMFAQSARRASGSCIRFSLLVRNTKRSTLDRRDLVELKAVIGPGDTAAPVITIMLPDQD